MEFDVNKFLEKYEIKKIMIIIIISFIVFMLIPLNWIEYIGNRLTNNSDLKNLVTFAVILCTVGIIKEILLPFVFKIIQIPKKKKTLLNLDKQHLDNLFLFYDSDLKKFNKKLEISEPNKYLKDLEEIGIVEYIFPIIMTRNSINKYKISDEYRKILDGLILNKQLKKD